MKFSYKKKNSQQQKNTESDGFTGKTSKHSEESTLILLKLFQKIAEEEMLPNSFYYYKASITLTPKLDKDNTKKENY